MEWGRRPGRREGGAETVMAGCWINDRAGMATGQPLDGSGQAAKKDRDRKGTWSG